MNKKDEIKTIRLDEISANPYQPRVNFNPEKLAELSQSISKNGVLQPIIVRQSGIFGYELLAGERRMRASELAGLKTIPAIVRTLTDQEMMTLSILENLQRDDMTPLEEARAYKNLVEKTGMTHQEIAESLGKSRPYVSNMIRILNLPRSVLQMVEEGLISAGHARVLLAVESPEALMALARRIPAERISVRGLEALVSESRTPKKAPVKTVNPFTADVESKLYRKFGVKSRVNARKDGSGKIEISFENLAELNRLLEELL